MSDEKLSLGDEVLVKTRGKEKRGLIVKNIKKPLFKTEKIQKVLRKKLLTAQHIELCIWLSSHYYCSLWSALKLFLPKVIWENKKSPSYQQWVELNISTEKTHVQSIRGKNQQKALKILKAKNPILQEELRKFIPLTTLKTLEKKEVISIKTGVLKNPFQKEKTLHKKTLQTEQKKAVDTLLNALDDNHKNSVPFLLHGVTGSGKTEVYAQVIDAQIKRGKQCLLLVPEIALTSQLIDTLGSRYGESLGVIHSRLSEGERLQVWHGIAQESISVIVGSRSALFSPWKNLGAVIVDEEHEWTYKQDSNPRYHTREVLLYLKHYLSPYTIVIFGSATPSIESYYLAQSDQFYLLELPHRINNQALPKVNIVDMRNEFRAGNYSMISLALQEALHHCLARKQQAVLMLNRRGFSHSVSCRDCGFIPHCKQCSVSLTYHQQTGVLQSPHLICHFCGLVERSFEQCPECNSFAIKQLGMGTQKAEQQLRELFPQARVLRIDKDTSSGKYDFSRYYQQIKNQDVDIVLGTQMIAKGLDFPQVTLVGVLMADIGLHIPDFRASERVFQLMSQVAGRSGRHQSGQVFIQSYQPHHSALQAVKTHNYPAFYQEEIQLRQQFNFPPFARIIRLSIKHFHPQEAEQQAKMLFSQLENIQRHHDGISIQLSQHHIVKSHGKYRWNITIRGKQPERVLPYIKLGKYWVIDVNPYT